MGLNVLSEIIFKGYCHQNCTSLSPLNAMKLKKGVNQLCNHY